MATGLRERKKERTRDALEAAALRLFEERGYDATTVEQIAEQADVSTRTFFRYYPTKADVLLRDQAGRLELVRSFLAARPQDEPIMTSLTELMTALADDLPNERHLLMAQYRWGRTSDDLLAAVRNHHAHIVDILTDFVARRLDRPDPVGGAARAVATACIASLVAVATEWLESDDERPDIDAALTSFQATIVVPT